jgi:hypothetical protein
MTPDRRRAILMGPNRRRRIPIGPALHIPKQAPHVFFFHGELLFIRERGKGAPAALPEMLAYPFGLKRSLVGGAFLYAKQPPFPHAMSLAPQGEAHPLAAKCPPDADAPGFRFDISFVRVPPTCDHPFADVTFFHRTPYPHPLGCGSLVHSARRGGRRANTSARRGGRRANTSARRGGRRTNTSARRGGRRANTSARRGGRRANTSARRGGRRANTTLTSSGM